MNGENEWEEAHKVVKEKSKELKSFCFQFQKLGQKKINYIKKEIEEIPDKTPKTKARDKTQKLEDELYKIIEKAEDLSASVDIVDKGFKDMCERVQVYKSSKEEEKKKGE